MTSILIPKNNYISQNDFQNRTLGKDVDALLYPGNNEAVRYLTEQISNLNISNLKLLDVGCGHGRWSQHLHGLYSSYLGVDPVKERIKSAKKLWNMPEVEFRELDLSTCEFSKQFDIAIFVDVLQHLGLFEAKELIWFASKCLKLNGCFLIWDGCIGHYTLLEAEQMYETNPEHMIPKPLSMLKSIDFSLTWTGDGCAWKAVKREYI